jgi:transposase
MLKNSEIVQRSSAERVQWRMRGTDQRQSHVFSYISPEERVRKDHPLRPIRTMVDEILKQLSPQFNKMYAKVGRPSIPPEQLLRAQLLQLLYSVRSERLLMEEMDYNILFRWFVGLNLDDPVWDATVFTKNRDRLLEAEVAKEFLARVVGQARAKGWTSDEHFTVDGTLLEAWASGKSFQAKDKKSSSPPDDPGNPTVNFHGEKRTNQTHESETDPDALLARKGAGQEAKLSYSGNLLVENRNGLIVSSMVWEATGTAERDAAMAMLQQVPGTGRVTVGGDKGFDTAEFVRECRNMRVTPHVAQNLARRGSAIDGRTTQKAGYRISQKKRKRIEECFGWLKTIALLRKVRHRGTLKVDWMFTFACAAYNLVRMRNLMAAAVPTQ